MAIGFKKPEIIDLTKAQKIFIENLKKKVI